MKAGEYVGRDGWTYRWYPGRRGNPRGEYFKRVREADDPDGIEERDCSWVAKEDREKEQAALDALIESEQEEWVEK